MRICSTCKLSELETEFTPKGKLCRECNKEYQRGHYKRNKAAYKDKSKQHRENLRKVLEEKKSHPCTDCGCSYPPCVMDFDHLYDKKDKVSNLVRDQVSVNTLLEEISKCELVCSNCHRIRTHILRK